MKPSDRTSIYSVLSTIGSVPRTALVQRMKTISAKKNIFMCAPGGYGKTVAARQWLSSVRGKTARMTVGDADNDPGFFYKRLALILLEFAGSKKGILDSSISFERLIEIIKLMPEKRVRCYLIIDDLHMIKNQEIIKNMPTIASRLPPYIGRCLISRSQPPPALLKTGLFELITTDDLLFSPEEVEYFGEEKDRELDSEQIDHLLKITGGWAMYLSAMLSDASLPDYNPSDLRKINKTPQTLTQYLDAKVWGLWDRQTKTLLLTLAVPTELNPKLAQALTGQKDGQGLLERLEKKENAFLSRTDKDTYRFHDIFREFLQERLVSNLGKEEVRRLNDIAAGWYYEQGDFYAGARHYIYNSDHEGINRCIAATNRYNNSQANLSVEVRLNFSMQNIRNLSSDFITKNPYLIHKSALAAYINGNAEEFFRYVDMLHQKLPEIAVKHPELAKTIGVFFIVDFRTPMREHSKRLIMMMRSAPPGVLKTEAPVISLTENLPFYHRSSRDYSEVFALNEEDVQLCKDTLSLIQSKGYEIMENAIYAGIYYERGELLQAMRCILISYNGCGYDNHPEIVFCSSMMFSAVLYAMGASQEADKIMEQMADYIEKKAQFLHPNFKALQTERAIRNGDTEAAREWLIVYGGHSRRLPFYQICRHFCTLRAYIALEDYKAAIDFGNRLQILAADYNRPLDRIESSLLTAIALWHNEEKSKAVKQLEQAISIAVPYGFTQLLLNEGTEILPILWELQEEANKPEENPPLEITGFVEKLIDTIYKKYDLKTEEETTLKLTAQQQSMLSYLSKGMSYSEIADVTGVGRSTVKYHLLLVYKRLGVRTAKQAVIKAKALGLLE